MKNNKSDKKGIKKYILIGSGIVLAVIIISLLPFFKSSEIIITEYHPFKTPGAKQEYLKAEAKRSKSWPVPFESVYADTSYGKTYARVSGSRNAPPLVLLPGKGGNSFMWYRAVKELSGNYRVYAVDPVFERGLSVHTRTITKADEIIEWLDELFTELDLGNKINLMGLSYGGWLTGQYALRYPERLRKAILVAPADTILPIKSQFYIRGLLMIALPFRYFKEQFFLWLFEDAAVQGEEGMRLIKKMADSNEEDSRLFVSIPGIVMPTVLTDNELQSIKIPVLFIVGENEKIYSAQEAVKRIKGVSPAIKTKIIPNAGHGIIFSQPGLFNKAVIEFLK